MSDEQDRIIKLLVQINNNQLSMNQNVWCIGLLNMLVVVIILAAVVLMYMR